LIRVRRALSKLEFPLGLQSGKGVAVSGDVALNVDVAGGAPDGVFEGVSVWLGVGVPEGVAVTVDVLDGVDVGAGVLV
jgi:hypothetical protein